MRFRALAPSVFLFLASTASTLAVHADPQRAPDARVTPAPAPAPELHVVVEAQRARLAGALRPELRAKLSPVAQAVLRAAEPPATHHAARPPVNLLAAARSELAKARYLGIASRADADIDALTFIVLAEAAKSAQDDLRGITAEVRAINAAKHCLRDRACIAGLKPTAEISAEALKRVQDAAKQNLDSLSEMGEMESLRLQMAMDRLSKLMSTLSNLLKKASDTASGIVQNIK